MLTFRACANWTGASAARDKGKPLRWEPPAARDVRGLGVAALPFGLMLFCLTADLQIRAARKNSISLPRQTQTGSRCRLVKLNPVSFQPPPTPFAYSVTIR